MFLLAAVGFAEYAIFKNNGTEIGPMIDMMPRVVKIMFGMGELPMDTAEGWYACMYLWLSFIAFMHAALLGANIISKEEREKTSEFLFTRPIKRSTTLAGKMLAAVLNVLALALVAWATSLAVLYPHINGTSMVSGVSLTMLGMFITQMVFLFTGFLFSTLSPGRSGSYAAVAVIVAYIIAVLIEIQGNVDFLNVLSPFRYFHAAGVLADGLSWVYVALSAVLCAAAGFSSRFIFAGRDLRN